MRLILRLTSLVAVALSISCTSAQQFGAEEPAVTPQHSDSATVLRPESKPQPTGTGKIVAGGKAPKVMPPSPAHATERATSNGAAASATIGAPNSELAREEGAALFAEGISLLGSHKWNGAAERFREAIAKDGSVAEYYGSLGKVMMIQHNWLEAQAAYSAAVLLDLDNTEYKTQLKLARSRR